MINKKDLYDADEIRYAENLAYLYKYIGYDVKIVSVSTGEGMEEIKDLLKTRLPFFPDIAVSENRLLSMQYFLTRRYVPQN